MDYEIFRFALGNKVIIFTPWELFGMVGVSLFTARWFVQMYYSRRQGKPVIPRAFWLMSISGSLITLLYFALRTRPDPVGILQNLFPSFIAGYNLYLDLTHSKKAEAGSAPAAAETPKISRREATVPPPEPVAANK